MLNRMINKKTILLENLQRMMRLIMLTEALNKKRFKRLKPEIIASLSVQEQIQYYELQREYFKNLPLDKEKLTLYHKEYMKYAKVIVFLTHLLHKPQVIGKENIPTSSGNIYISNHTSSFDQIMILCALGYQPRHFIAKTKLFEINFEEYLSLEGKKIIGLLKRFKAIEKMLHSSVGEFYEKAGLIFVDENSGLKSG